MGVALEVHRSAPTVDGGHQFAELAAPVADVVDPDRAVTESIVQALDCGTDDGRTQVADGHRLGDVGRGEVDHHGLAVTLLAAAIGGALSRDLPDDRARQQRAIDLEVEIRPRGSSRDAL